MQKKPFFSSYHNQTGRKLWSIVIDGADIEFVTEPFSNNEKELLLKAIQGIQMASSLITKPIKRTLSDVSSNAR
ncbi:MAG: hypothetical protein A2007_00420 [Verrucomicrobia bacterium GWC2_42_7]|nr:MAG: hypothetical protein A2007_00420 [Verrucomicrobia bacterium GWC2_42_7]